MSGPFALPDPAVRRALCHVRPRTRGQLRAWVRAVLGFDLPPAAIVAGHATPLDYLSHAFFEDDGPRDCLIWANRGGGKTQLGAIATLLDLLFKPGIEVRILGGSFEQSSKMYGYLKRLLEDDLFRELVDGRITGRAVQLRNGSRVEVLSQSERAVRGQRVHRLRCDEVELFEPEIWDAAQLITRSGMCGDMFVRASIEAMSTMHQPFGLMQQLVRDADRARRRIFRWNVIDTLARCPPERPCEGCPLWDDCRGRAKQARGFIAIDDAIAQRQRVGDAVWRAEMLCERPTRSSTVYPEFDQAVHVRTFDVPGGAQMLGGMDFGHRVPTVLLWAFLPATAGREAVLHVVDELVVSGELVEKQIALAGQRPWPRPRWIGADPAGHTRNDQTGWSTIARWREAGWPIRTRRTSIAAGIDAVHRRLRRADGASTLVIHPRCEALIRAMTMYHYPRDNPACPHPVKDGHDHAADALRYLIVNLDREAWNVHIRSY